MKPVLKMLGAALFAVATVAQAAYPEKPIVMVVPFAAGGPTDTVARNMASAMTKVLGQQVVVENQGGAGGTLGAGRVAKAAPDGYTVLLHHIGMSTAPALYRKLSFDPLKDFEYIGLVNDVPMTVISKPDFPAKDIKEFITYVKANGKKINLANAGLGSASHLCGLLFMSSIQTDMTTVPFRGTAPAMTDLIGGQVDIMCDQTTNTTAQIAGNRVKAYAVTSPKRLNTPALKSLPTLADSGLTGFDVSVWHGMYAPKGTPKEVVAKLNSAMKTALKDPDLLKRFGDLGAEVVAESRQTPEAHAAHVKAEIDKWTPIIKKAGEYAD